MMTIDELLNVASENIGFARLTNTIDQQECAICAAIAQAAAQTAQAMILAQAMPPTLHGLMRVLQVETSD